MYVSAYLPRECFVWIFNCVGRHNPQRRGYTNQNSFAQGIFKFVYPVIYNLIMLICICVQQHVMIYTKSNERVE